MARKSRASINPTNRLGFLSASDMPTGEHGVPSRDNKRLQKHVARVNKKTLKSKKTKKS